MRTTGRFALLHSLLLALPAFADTPVRTAEFESPTYEIDRVYRSMKGPEAQERVFLENTSQPELLWITGYSTQIMDHAAEKRTSDEFMCHSNLALEDVANHGSFWAGRGSALGGCSPSPRARCR